LSLFINLAVAGVMVAASVLMAASLFFLTKKYAVKLFGRRRGMQRYALATVKGPISLLIVATGVISATGYLNSRLPGLLPGWVETSYLAIVAEILVVILAVRIVGVVLNGFLIARSERLSKQRPEVTASLNILRRMIVYSLYLVSLIAVIYIFIASPLTPAIGTRTVSSALYFIAGVAAVFMLVYVLNVVTSRYIHGLVVKEPKLMTTYFFLRRLMLMVVSFIGVAAVTLSTFPTAGGVIASIFVAAGFASIVIGLAAQSSLSNIISGMLVAISQPFRIGEAVVFKNDFCFVEDIKLVHTILRTWDNRRLMVPNSVFQSEVIINYSIGDPTMLVPVFVQISYESDLDKAMKIMVEVAKKHPDCMPIGNLPNVVVMEYAESGISLRLLSRAKDQPTAFMMARDLLYQIKKEFDANGIEIPYPRRFMVLDRRVEEQIAKIAEGLQTLVKNMQK